jgi:CRP-like cAMP-binding protein
MSRRERYSKCPRRRHLIPQLRIYDGRLDNATALSSCAIFQGSSPGDFSPVLSSLSRRHYDAGQYIWRAGDPASWMYVVLTGEVHVSRTDPGGNQYVIEVYIQGDALGQLPFFDKDPARFTDGCAGTETECLLAPRKAVLALLREKPNLMVSMLSAYSRWIRTRDMHSSETAFQNLAGRVARKLVELGSRYGEPGPDGVRIPIRLTHETIANMLGASRENVSRALSLLAQRGEVRRTKRLLVIPNLADLAQRYSDFDETRHGVVSRGASPTKVG